MRPPRRNEPGPTACRNRPVTRQGMKRRRGDWHNPADRLDPVGGTIVVDEGDHVRGRRSSSAIAKYALALRRISLACCSSRFSRSSALIRARSSAVGPAVGLGPARLGAPSSSGSRPSSRSWPQSSGSLRIASRARPDGRTPSAPHVRGPPAERACFASSWLHPLKSWSLRKTRCGSVRAGPTPRDQMEGGRSLGDGLAIATGEALAHVLNHDPARRFRFRVSVTSSPEWRRRVPLQQAQVVGSGCMTRSRSRCSGRGRRADLRQEDTAVAHASSSEAACASVSASVSSSSSSVSSSWLIQVLRSTEAPYRSRRSRAISSFRLRR